MDQLSKFEEEKMKEVKRQFIQPVYNLRSLGDAGIDEEYH